MVNGLAYQQLIIENAERIEPPFSPDVFEYNVYPIPGPSDMYFSVVMNTEPAESNNKPAFDYWPFPNYQLKHKTEAIEIGYYTDRVIPNTSANPTEFKYKFNADKKRVITVTISCCEGSAAVPGAIPDIVLHVQPRALAEGECGHFETYTVEGEWWGGSSGSCDVEYLIFCRACREQVGKTYEHRD